MRDLNIDWLTPLSEDFKSMCDGLNLIELLDKATQILLYFPSGSMLPYLTLTKVPQIYRISWGFLLTMQVIIDQ